jgi:hypothetical protein
LQLLDGSGTELSISTDLVVTPGTWHTIIACYDGTTLTAYLLDVTGGFATASATISDLTNSVSTGFITGSPFYFDDFEVFDYSDDCPCPVVIPTTSCTSDTCIGGVIAENWALIVDGIANAGCSNCTSANGTYYMTIPDSQCCEVMEIERLPFNYLVSCFDPNDVAFLSFGSHQGGGGECWTPIGSGGGMRADIAISDGFLAGNHRYYDSGASDPVDCATSYTLSYQSGGSNLTCDYTGVTVTAIPMP